MCDYQLLKYQQYLNKLPKLHQEVADFKTLYKPDDFCSELLRAIIDAKNRVYLVTLYLEHDQGGEQVLDTLYQAKKINSQLDIAVLVDWHRAQRSRIGSTKTSTNADWYCTFAQKNSDVDVPIYGVPVNTREALGVFHLKGFIIDNTIIYSGANINNLYLHHEDKYRYDRYKIINNWRLANALLDYIRILLIAPAVNRLNNYQKYTKRRINLKINKNTRALRQSLRITNYCFEDNAKQNELAITPLVGLGKQSILNQTIHNLICSTHFRIILCTPYFNMPSQLVQNLIFLLGQGKQVEIIVGDKTANDFYIPEDQDFKVIGIIPYMYEINLRRFLIRLQCYLNNGQLIVRLWKNENNSYHLKGIWVDYEWQLLTGNNLNPRAWRLDLENALLIHDPQQALLNQHNSELDHIRTYTNKVNHFTDLQSTADYPIKVCRLIRRLRRIRIDRLISQIL